MRIALKKDLTGSILDIGGGGEGVIGRLYGGQAVAIDNRQEELDEAPGGFEKRLMDARALAFADECFDHVTFFYSAMYFSPDDLQTALREAERVLRPGGRVHLWDAEIESGWPEPFVVELEVETPAFALRTGYGVGRTEPQSAGGVAALCRAAGLALVERRSEKGQFHLVFEKGAAR